MKLYKQFLTFIGAFLCINCFAQSENYEITDGSTLYFKVYGAYGIFTPGSYKGVSRNNNYESNVFDANRSGAITVNINKRGMGGGIRMGAGVGMILNEYLNIGIDAEYLMGNKITNNVNSAPGLSLKLTQKRISVFNHQVLSIIPNLVFKIVSKPDYYVYNRLGVIIGIPQEVTERGTVEYYEDSTSRSELVTGSYEGIHKLKTAVGYQAVLGAQVKFSQKIKGFAEIAIYGITFNRIQYEDTKRVTKKSTVTDESRFINQYQGSGITKTWQWLDKDGKPQIKDLPPEIGLIPGAYGRQMPEYIVPPNTVYRTTSQQSPINMNAVTLGIGIVVSL